MDVSFVKWSGFSCLSVVPYFHFYPHPGPSILSRLLVNDLFGLFAFYVWYIWLVYPLFNYQIFEGKGNSTLAQDETIQRIRQTNLIARLVPKWTNTLKSAASACMFSYFKIRSCIPIKENTSVRRSVTYLFVFWYYHDHWFISKLLSGLMKCLDKTDWMQWTHWHDIRQKEKIINESFLQLFR